MALISFCSLIPMGLLGQMSHVAKLPRQLLARSPGCLPQVHPDVVAPCLQYKKSLKILRMHLTHIFQTGTTCWLPFLTKNLLFVPPYLNQESSLPMTSLVPLSQPTAEAKFGFHSPHHQHCWWLNPELRTFMTDEDGTGIRKQNRVRPYSLVAGSFPEKEDFGLHVLLSRAILN